MVGRTASVIPPFYSLLPGSTASLYTLSMEIWETAFFYWKQILINFSMKICCFFLKNYCQQVKSCFLLTWILISLALFFFLFWPFLFVSCYPNGKVPGSDLDVDSESVAFLDKLKLNLNSVCHLVLLNAVKLICSYCSQYCIVHYHSVVMYAC